MDDSFDVVIIGTLLPHSILASALSKIPLKVLHISSSETYGDVHGSLSLVQLHHFITHPPSSISNVTAPLPLGQEVLKKSRDYSIALTPSVVPSIGELVDALVGSGVASYVPFKLVDGVGLYADGQVKAVPGSKEDVFKSKELSLLQKRKLMKFLMGTAQAEDESGGEGGFLEYLTSKEVGLERPTAEAVGYALALCPDPNEPSKAALKRLKKYILSTGRHGNSPFIVAHFGGLGEIVQGFCRSCAVEGGTYILGREFTVMRKEGEYPFEIGVEGIEGLKAKVVVSAREELPAGLLEAGGGEEEYWARGIVILEGEILFRPKEDKPPVEEEQGEESGEVDTAILVFPPHSLPGNERKEVVTAFISGPGSMTCPDGQRIVHLSTRMQKDQSPEEILTPYLQAIRTLNRPTSEPSNILGSVFYTQRITTQKEKKEEDGIVLLSEPGVHLAEVGDQSAKEAERAFWSVLGVLGLDGREKKAATAGDSSMGGVELINAMWPVVERPGEDD